MRSLRVAPLLLFVGLAVGGCASGGGLATGGVNRVELTRLAFAAPTASKRQATAVALTIAPIPEHVTVDVKELLPDQVSFLRAPRVLGRVEVDGVRAVLVSRVKSVLEGSFTAIREGGGAVGADAVQPATLRFHELRIELDGPKPPDLAMDVSTCERDGKASASDAVSESTTTFGAVPEAQQRAYLHVSAELELVREEKTADQSHTLIEHVAIDGTSDGFPLDTRDLDGMFQQALRRGFIHFADRLPAALARLERPSETIEALLREVCAERKPAK